jgi:PEP-CTERM motif-containing protein
LKKNNNFLGEKDMKKNFVLILAIVMLAYGTTAQAAFVAISDDFNSYPLGTWPTGWVANANAVSDPANNNIVADPANPANNVFRLYGTTTGSWGANAFKACDFPESYTLDIAVRNGSEVANGVQPTRAAVHMRHGTNWPASTNPARGLLSFNTDGNVMAGDGRVLQTYVTDRWYDIKIQYDRVGTDLALQYWIDGVNRGVSQIIIPDLAVELSLNHVGLTAAQGSAYFDDLSVVPEPATLCLLGLGGLLLRRRKSV